MAIALAFGSYTFPKGFHVADDPEARIIPGIKALRQDGGRQLTGYVDRKRVVLRGGIYKGPMDTSDARTRLDSLRNAMSAGPANLTLYDDRYYRNAQCEVVDFRYQPTGFNRLADVEIVFSLEDPFQYANSATTDTWTVTASGQTRNISSPGGNAPPKPKFSITVGGAGAQTIAFTITNTTTSESFTLAGSVTGGDVIVVDSLLQTVKIGSTDKLNLFDGIFPGLAESSNTLSETYTSSSITQIVTEYNARFW